MKKIYIDGCGGMLGEAFYEVFKEDYEIKCTDKDVNADWLEYMDFNNFDDFKKDVIDYNPDYLFHLGACTDLEWCEENEITAMLTNAMATEEAVKIANELDIPILYVSTAGIFDGEKAAYHDWDTPNPISVYGKSKYAGERFVVEHAKRYLIMRAGWMMGGGDKDKKFVKKIIDQILRGAKTIYAVGDKYGTPTYTYDFAKTCKSVIETERWGLYNCVCSGDANRFDIANEIVKDLGMSGSVNVEAVDSEFFSKEYFSKRPASECLLSCKLDTLGLNKMRDWKTCLKEYIEKNYGNLIK